MMKRLGQSAALLILWISTLYAVPGAEVSAQEQSAAPAGGHSQIVVVVKASPNAEMETTLAMEFPRLAAELKKAAKGKAEHSGAVPFGDVYVRLPHDDGTYVLAGDGKLYHERTGEALRISSRAEQELRRVAEQLRRVHYGELLPWKEAKKLVPKKGIITVVDLETGLSFKAQRRAGKHHADVQPLTAQDSAVMKQIYRGTWSWDRKAILVKADGRVLAASMNGMPHGGDGIPGNKFAGHFCIHFLDSTTHRSKKVDPDHQLMVWKASGQLDLYLARLSPEELVRTFFSALNMKDEVMLKMMFTRPDDPQLPHWLNRRDQFAVVRARSLEEEADVIQSLLSMVLPVDVRVYPSGGRKPYTAAFLFRLERSSPADAWKIAEVKEGR
jgi:hypothetical protein